MEERYYKKLLVTVEDKNNRRELKGNLIQPENNDIPGTER